MFIVDSGLIEIQIPNPETGKATRLAAFGPGSIFGEISLLSTDQRTADAICVERAHLHEFGRDALKALEAQCPQLHARVLGNLGVHLAQRLVITTRTVQAHQ